jgi:nucleoside-diphosphate-sugar epimerase
MRILVVGAGGFIGRFGARHLQASGHEVIGLSRSRPADMSGLADHIAADRQDAAAIARIVRERSIDTVIDLLAFTQGATAPLLDALDGRGVRYVLASSADVYRNFGKLHRKESGKPLLGALDEDSPLRESRFPYRGVRPRSEHDPMRWLDDYDKIPIEQNVVARSDLDWTILRLPMIFGPGDRQRRFRWVIQPIASGAKSIAVPRAWAAWRTTYGYIDDVAAGIVLAATHSAARRRIFNLGMNEAPTHAEWVARFAIITGWRGDIEDDTDPASPLNAAIAGLALSVPLVLATQRIRSELGYREVVDGETALRRTLEDELRHSVTTQS